MGRGEIICVFMLEFFGLIVSIFKIDNYYILFFDMKNILYYLEILDFYFNVMIKWEFEMILFVEGWVCNMGRKKNELKIWWLDLWFIGNIIIVR